jgi:excisionase family DNA binding protein
VSRDRLLAALSPDVVAAIEELIAERVREALEANGSGDGSPWLSVEEAADYLGVSRRMVERRVKAGQIVPTYFGRRPLFRRDDLKQSVRKDDE